MENDKYIKFIIFHNKQNDLKMVVDIIDIFIVHNIILFTIYFMLNLIHFRYSVYKPIISNTT